MRLWSEDARMSAHIYGWAIVLRISWSRITQHKRGKNKREQSTLVRQTRGPPYDLHEIDGIKMSGFAKCQTESIQKKKYCFFSENGDTAASVGNGICFLIDWFKQDTTMVKSVLLQPQNITHDSCYIISDPNHSSLLHLFTPININRHDCKCVVCQKGLRCINCRLCFVLIESTDET